jgi:hypothetical protein
LIHSIYSPARLLGHKRYSIIVIFSIGCLVRIAPELAGYPYPIGYDVINYYIPVLTHFDMHWDTVSKEFPLYVSLLHIIAIATGASPYVMVLVSATVMYGIFAVSIFFVGTRMLKINTIQSVFVAVFVIIQMAVLRTSWDLHRDIFSLSFMLITLLLISADKKKDVTRNRLVLISTVLALSSIVAISDRMIGGLFCISVIIYSIMVKNKVSILSCVTATTFFAFALLTGHNILTNVLSSTTSYHTTVTQSQTNAKSYNVQNLLVSFLAVNGLLVPTGIIGLKYLNDNNNRILKISFIVTMLGSFSWIIYPDKEMLVADRWIILSAIFMSIFAGYGFIKLTEGINTSKAKMKSTILLFIVAIFSVIGVSYAIMPYNSPFILYSIVRGIGTFEPTSMQFNSYDIKDNPKILSAIYWIDKNTESNAVIFGSAHLRGWMELELTQDRIFHFFRNTEELDHILETKKYHDNVYLFKVRGDNIEYPEIGQGQTVYMSEMVVISRMKFCISQTTNCYR